MEYYTLLQLKGEPFSNSPDPDYFFQSRQHHSCLQKLELAVRLKRGLNVVVGDVGTGKTTMCRELIRKFAQTPEIESHLILDPSLPSSETFLRLFHGMLCQSPPDEAASEVQIKERVKQTLFQKGVDENKTVVLIIDEGQKISSACVEAIRELLNYETNHFKLLQIVIFAQSEFESILRQHANFADRINLLHHLGPMNFTDTRQMIHHRLKLASRTAKPRDLFTLPALWAIYRATGGYPRKIVHLCHQSVLAMIIQNRTRAGWALIRSCRKRITLRQRSRRGAWAMAGITLAAFAMVAFLWTRNANIGADYAAAPISEAAHPAATETAAPEPPAPPPLVQEQQTATEIAEAPPAESETAAHTLPAAAMVLEPLQPLPQSEASPPSRPALSVAAAATGQVPPAPVKIEPPAMLGDLAVRPGDTFLGLVYLVYGTKDNTCLRAVIEANPHIVNPNAIDLDDVISFPALAAPPGQWPADAVRVVLDRQTTLAAARGRLETMRRIHHLAVRLVAQWVPEDGLQFTAVSARHFKDARETQWWIDRLPEELKSRAGLQTGWPRGAILYSRLPIQADRN